ncbi:lymphocyte cytosolic protein 2a [Chanos chanos]|uniref:Lymphocyte cytosolic protein 2a n=1 Tax=Chanos chanos TaxID=29144 RepID=A0A6J2VYS3_CHACN|nr:lymphocyte cytosolic protein 2-like [Chanos chanos]
MNFDNIPTKSEVMSWDAPRLADFLKRQDLRGCDKVILKCNMSGQRFLNMTENDLQKFPKLHAPLIIKICSEINKKEEKRRFFTKRAPAPKYHEPDIVHEDQGWSSEEFDQSDEDYEDPDANIDDEGSGGDYESPTEGPVGEEVDSDNDNDYEPPPSDSDELQHRPICPAINNSDYIDRLNHPPPEPPMRPGVSSLPPMPHPHIGGSYPRPDHSPQRPSKPQAKLPSGPPAPLVDRSKKPTTLERNLNDSLLAGKVGGRGQRSATPPRRPPVAERPPDPMRMPKPPLPSATGVRRSASALSQNSPHSRLAPDPRNEFHDDNAKLPSHFNSHTFPLQPRNPSPRPPHSSHSFHSESLPPNMPPSGSLPSRLQDAMNSHRSSSRGPRPPMRHPEPDLDDNEVLDPAWYVGQVRRDQAEGCLRRVNQDGAFLVRDSSKGSPTQPYTLMVLYQDKVYNIQIRYNAERNSYLLGTGMKSSEMFQGVRDIITQHMQLPLLLIDAKNRSSGHQNQCTLSRPAGY